MIISSEMVGICSNPSSPDSESMFGHSLKCIFRYNAEINYDSFKDITSVSSKT